MYWISLGSSHHHSYSSQQVSINLHRYIDKQTDRWNVNYPFDLYFQGFKASGNLDIEMGNITSSSVAFPSTNPNLDSQNVDISEDSSVPSLHTTTTSSGRNSSSPGNSIENETQSNQRILRCMAEAKFSSPIECLETYFQLSIRAPPTSDFPIYEKVWLTLCRYVCVR
jgi:hypothetical protein